METISGEFRDRFGDFLARYDVDSANTRRVLADILTQAQATNGRVRDLENWRSGHQEWTAQKSESIAQIRRELDALMRWKEQSIGYARAWIAAASLAAGVTTALFSAVIEKYLK